MTAAEEVAREMNAWAQGFFGRAIVTDWRAQLDFTTKIFRARGLHLDDRHVRRADGAGFSASIVDVTLFVLNNQRRAPRVRFVARALSAEDTDSRGGGALARHPGGAREPPGAAGRHDQDIRAGGAARGGVSADGDPRGARPALRWLQHRTMGLHQQRVGRARLGPGVHQPEYRRGDDDLRVHAQLRGSRAPRGEYAGPEWRVRSLAGGDGTEYPGGVCRRGDAGDGAGSRRRRARAAGGGERQVGRPLEDGPHRPARVGESRARPISSDGSSLVSRTRRATPRG